MDPVQQSQWVTPLKDWCEIKQGGGGKKTATLVSKSHNKLRILNLSRFVIPQHTPTWW